MRLRAERAARRSEAGLTLIEAIVTMFIISVAIVGLVGAFAAAERSAASAVTQTQAEVLMRQAGDALRQPQPYVACAAPGAYSVPSGVSIDDLYVAPGGTVAGGGAAAAHFDCTNSGAVVNGACPAGHTCDYGVQRIDVTVTYATGTLTRVVYKGAY
jgi:Tfp pilus assembly protein PilV